MPSYNAVLPSGIQVSCHEKAQATWRDCAGRNPGFLAFNSIWTPNWQPIPTSWLPDLGNGSFCPQSNHLSWCARADTSFPWQALPKLQICEPDRERESYWFCLFVVWISTAANIFLPPCFPNKGANCSFFTHVTNRSPWCPFPENRSLVIASSQGAQPIGHVANS